MESIILIVHVLLALGIIGLVLLQQGKGASTGASFGAGASATVFGSEGSGSFLTRTTAVLATLFFVTSMALAFVAKDKASIDAEVGMPDQQLIDAQAEALPVLSEEGLLPDLAIPTDSDLPAVNSEVPTVDE